MLSSTLREINWPSLVLNTVYVLALGLALAFFGRLLGLEQIGEFVPLLSIAVALITMWIAYRVALRAGRQPLLHGLLLGLMVGAASLLLNLLTNPISVVEGAAFLLQLLGGLLGGRSAQRALTRTTP